MAFVAALLTGVLTAAGIGGGTLLVLWLTAFSDMTAGAIGGVNLLYYMATAPAALYHHLKNRLIELKGGAIAALTGSACAALAAYISGSAQQPFLKKALGVLFIAVGIRELFTRKK